MSSAPTASLQRFAYTEAIARQLELVLARQRGETPDGVWYLEHHPVVTWNPGRGRQHLLVSEEDLALRGVALEACDRGGDVTYHGPGQLVGYPIVDLSSATPPSRDLHAYLRTLEDALIDALRSWEIVGTHSETGTGVWVPERGDSARPAKIAAMGVRVRKWVSSHGFALNVSCDLTPFRDLIVPCGIASAGVTSLSERLGDSPHGVLPGGFPVETADAVEPVHRALEARLGRPLARTYNGKDWWVDE